MKPFTNHWLTGKEILLELRIKYLQVRLKSNNKIYQNLPFVDIEKNYEGRAANLQVASWRTVSFERGSLYTFYETVDGQQKSKIAIELPRRVFLANEAYVFSGRGIVYNAYYNCTVLETIETWGNDVNYSTEYLKITKTPTRTLDGLAISLLSLGAVSNYAHFLFDSLTKLTLLKNLPKEPDWLLISGPKTIWKEKILNYLNIRDKIIWVTETDEIRCEQLVFTSRINSSRHISPFAGKAVRIMFLSEKRETPASPPHRVVFASRKSTKDRKSGLEDLFHNFLPEFVEIVDFESLSMEETIRICQECKFFLGIHGAAFANIVFCNRGIKIAEFRIEEILHEHNRNYYQTLSDDLGFDHQIYRLKEDMDENDLKKLIQEVL